MKHLIASVSLYQSRREFGLKSAPPLGTIGVTQWPYNKMSISAQGSVDRIMYICIIMSLEWREGVIVEMHSGKVIVHKAWFADESGHGSPGWKPTMFLGSFGPPEKRLVRLYSRCVRSIPLIWYLQPKLFRSISSVANMLHEAKILPVKKQTTLPEDWWSSEMGDTTPEMLRDILINHALSNIS